MVEYATRENVVNAELIDLAALEAMLEENVSETQQVVEIEVSSSPSSLSEGSETARTLTCPSLLPPPHPPRPLQDA